MWLYYCPSTTFPYVSWVLARKVLHTISPHIPLLVQWAKSLFKEAMVSPSYFIIDTTMTNIVFFAFHFMSTLWGGSYTMTRFGKKRDLFWVSICSWSLWFSCTSWKCCVKFSGLLWYQSIEIGTCNFPSMFPSISKHIQEQSGYRISKVEDHGTLC